MGGIPLGLIVAVVMRGSSVAIGTGIGDGDGKIWGSGAYPRS